MGAFKNIIEPLCLVLIFTAGTLINRHRPWRRELENGNGHGHGLVSEKRLSWPPAIATPIPIPMPDNSAFRHNATSRILNTYPFLLEIWYWNLIYWPYQLARSLTAHLIDAAYSKPDILLLARAHALSILWMEKQLGLAVERGFQAFMFQHYPALLPFLAFVYYSHMHVGVAFLVYAYTFFPRPTYQRIRRAFLANNWLAFALLSFLRVAPPRLLPAQFGFVDVLHGGFPQQQQQQQQAVPNAIMRAPEQAGQPYQLTSSRAAATQGSMWVNNPHQLTIAAMPSLHFGTSLLLACCLAAYSPHRPLRLLAPLWPLLMLVSIVATANHFLLDAVVGAAVVWLGWRVNGVVLVLRPLEEWAFWLARTERPPSAEVGRERERERAGDLLGGGR